jgi:flagellar hook assembly protein FlgD
MSIHDVTGRLVRSFGSRELGAGTHAITWNLKQDDGSSVRPGVYYIRIQAGVLRAAVPILVVR